MVDFFLRWFSCDNIDWLQLNQISSLTEKRPSITEKELTPIVLNQLQSTKKHKVRTNKQTIIVNFTQDELRKARRGSAPKPEVALPGELQTLIRQDDTQRHHRQHHQHNQHHHHHHTITNLVVLCCSRHCFQTKERPFLVLFFICQSNSDRCQPVLFHW